MEKRCTVMSTEGILYQATDTNSFEIDLEIHAAHYPNWAYITMCARFDRGPWREVATIYRNMIAK